MGRSGLFFLVVLAVLLTVAVSERPSDNNKAWAWANKLRSILDKQQNNELIDNVTLCEVCEFVARYAAFIIQRENLTTDEVLAELDKWCNYLGNYSSDCLSVVNTVGWLIVTEIEYGASPAVVCNTAFPGVCPFLLKPLKQGEQSNTVTVEDNPLSANKRIAINN
jgi:hypothetical protein